MIQEQNQEHLQQGHTNNQATVVQNEKAGNQKQGEEQIQVKSLNHLSLYYTYIQRYYTTYQSKNQFVHMHSNGLFMIRPKLSALPARPLQIHYLLENVEVKGKKKRGGVRVKPNTYIAKIVCEGGETAKITACVQGTIIESNHSIKIELIQKDESYLVIILPSRRFIPQQAGMQRIVYMGNNFTKQ